MKASDVKKGNVIEHNNAVYQVRDIEKSSAQGRGGNVTYRFTIYSVANGNKVDLTMRADDDLKELDLMRRESTFSQLKGGSATKRTKPAKLSTGLEINVPEYIANGDKVQVSTVTGEFGGRAQLE